VDTTADCVPVGVAELDGVETTTASVLGVEVGVVDVDVEVDVDVGV